MFIYNITTKLTWKIDTAWLTWMKEDHIPAIMATGCFTDHKFVRLLETDEDEGPTYAVQFFANSREEYDLYLEKYASSLRNNAAAKWGDQFISFRSLMQVVH